MATLAREPPLGARGSSSISSSARCSAGTCSPGIPCPVSDGWPRCSACHGRRSEAFEEGDSVGLPWRSARVTPPRFRITAGTRAGPAAPPDGPRRRARCPVIRSVLRPGCTTTEDRRSPRSVVAPNSSDYSAANRTARRREQDPVARQRHALAYWDHVVDAADSIVFRLMYNRCARPTRPALPGLSVVMVRSRPAGGPPSSC